LGFPIQIKNPYKLCDFKPAYGLLFSEHLTDCDFWGHGDIDVIFGNISNFIDDDVLNKYDVICLRHDFLTGYFTLFRNSSTINNLFKECADYKLVFQSPTHFCFDETNFTFQAFSKGLHYSEVTCEIDSMTHIVKRCQEQKVLDAYFDFHVIEGVPGRLKWIDGTLIYKDIYEVVLYHLIIFKRKHLKNGHKFIKGNFKITPTRILALK
jgi:hypothetical protein